nr:MAG TPA: major tail protein [Caudoviricetes sp.]
MAATRKASNVRSAVTGDVYIGDAHAGDTIDGVGKIPDGLTALGYLSDDGFKIKPERKTDDLKAWQNADVVRTVATESSIEISFQLIESKKEVIELFWQSKVTAGADSGSFDISPGATTGVHALLMDIVDGDQVIRYYFPEAELVDRDEIKGKNGEVYGYGVTLKAYPAQINNKGDAVSGRGWMTALKADTPPVPPSPKPQPDPNPPSNN